MSFLLDTTLRISLVILVALGLALALRRRPAALRHWVLAIGIGCAALAPLLQGVLPAWHVAPSFAGAALEQEQGPDVTTGITLHGAAAGTTQPATAVARQEAPFELPSLAALSIVLWLSGALLGLSSLAAGLWRLSRIESGTSRIGEGRLAAIADELRESMGVGRDVRLLQGNHSAMLVTWGASRPRIVLPPGANQWPEDRARLVLRHEFAHVARGDWLAQMLAEALRAVYWFNPLIWVACRRLRSEAERACDDAVLNGGAEPAQYAGHLLELAKNATGRRRMPAISMARPSSLEGRIRAMLNARINRRPVRKAARIVTAAALAALTVTVTSAQMRFSSFTGTVLDQTSRLLPGAVVVLTNTANKAKYEVTSNASGHFEFVVLPPGDYDLAVQLPGFKTLKEKVSLAGQDLTRTFQLQIGSLKETVTVTSAPPAPSAAAADHEAQEKSRERAERARRLASERCAGVPQAVPASGDGPAIVGGTVIPPVKVVDVRPEYPAALKAAGIAGPVVIEALIGTDGFVRDVNVVSSPHPDLERAAAEAVRRWEFTPTYLNCTPLEISMTVTVNFAAK